MPAFWPFLPHFSSEQKGTVEKVAPLGEDITEPVGLIISQGCCLDWALFNHISYENFSHTEAESIASTFMSNIL